MTKEFKRDGLRQFISSFVVFLPVLSNGMASGWTSPTQKYLTANQSDTIHPAGGLTQDEFSWITSSVYIGGFISCLWWNLVTETFGRKIAGYIIGLLMTISWLGITCSLNFIVILLCRLVLGISCSGSVVVGVAYTNEITSERLKAPLCSIGSLFINSGFLIVSVCGLYFPYDALNYVCLSVPVIFLASFTRLPESPIYLLMERKDVKAKKSLMWFRGNKTHKVDRELAVADASQVLKKKTTITDLFASKSVTLTILNGSILLVGQQFSGITVLTSYTENIFENSSSSMYAAKSTTIVGVLLVLGCIIPCLFSSKINQKFTLICSFVLAALTLLVMGWSFDYAGDNKVYKILPLICLYCYIVIFSSSIGPTPYILYTRMFSTNIMSLGISICQFLGTISAFVTSKVFYILVERLGYGNTFYILVACNLFMVVYVFLFISDERIDESSPMNGSEIRGNGDLEKVKLDSVLC